MSRHSPKEIERIKRVAAKMTISNQSQGSLAPESSSAALTFGPKYGKVVFEINNGELIIHDPDNAWKDWYSLSKSESIQLATWLLREQQNK